MNSADLLDFAMSFGIGLLISIGVFAYLISSIGIENTMSNLFFPIISLIFSSLVGYYLIRRENWSHSKSK